MTDDSFLDEGAGDIRENAKFSQRVLDAVPASIAVLDRSGVITLVNEYWRRFARENGFGSGTPVRNIEVGVNYLEICRAATGSFSEEARAACDGILAVLEGRAKSFSLEYPCDSPTKKRWFSMSVAPVEEERASVLVMHTDITARRQAEEGLKASHAQLQSFVQQAPPAIAMFDLNMNYLAVSNQWIARYGRGHADLVGRNYYQVTPDMPAGWRLIHQRGLAGETIRNDEDEWIFGDGSKHILRWNVQPWRDIHGAIGGIIIAVEDITGRKRAERQVSDMAVFLKNVLDNQPIPVFIKDKAGRYLACSRTFEEFHGFEHGSIIGKTALDVFSPDIATTFADLDKKMYAGGATLVNQHVFTRADGEKRDIIVHLTPLTLVDGIVDGLIGTLSDVTSLKLSNEVILRQEKIIDRAPASIVSTDLHGKIIYWNQGAENLLGYRADEIVGRDISVLHFDEDLDFLRSDVIGPLRDNGYLDIEVRMRHHSGQPMFFHTSLWMTSNAQGEIDGMIGYGIDITEKKRVEEVLRESERKSEAERIRRLEHQRDALVREAHHRIKNHLQGVTSLLRMKTRNFADLSFPMEEIIQQIRSIAEAYGLQSARVDALVSLRTLLSSTVSRNEGWGPIRGDFGERDLFVPSEDVVPLALAINELIANALKHLASDRPDKFVDVFLCVDADTACIAVRNGPAELPRGFQLGETSGFGSGLNLVLTLLPSKRAKLSLRQDGPDVVAELVLSGLLSGKGG